MKRASLPLEREPVDIGQLLPDLRELALERPEAAGRHIELILPQAPWPLSAVHGDLDLLFLALHNLLNNTLKFTLPEDTTEIRAFEDGAWVVVGVADIGPGIPEDELLHLREELYRGSAASEIGGTG
jgi:signal transduction histidine kinase